MTEKCIIWAEKAEVREIHTYQENKGSIRKELIVKSFDSYTQYIVWQFNSSLLFLYQAILQTPWEKSKMLYRPSWQSANKNFRHLYCPARSTNWCERFSHISTIFYRILRRKIIGVVILINIIWFSISHERNISLSLISRWTKMITLLTPFFNK